MSRGGKERPGKEEVGASRYLPFSTCEEREEGMDAAMYTQSLLVGEMLPGEELVGGSATVSAGVTEMRERETRVQKILDTLLAMIDTLEVDITPSVSPVISTQIESSTSLDKRRLLELLCRLFDCQFAGLAGIDEESERLDVQTVMAATEEQERFWRNRVQGMPVSTFVHEKSALEALNAGEVTVQNIGFGQIRGQLIQKSIVPIRHGQRLIGVLQLERLHTQVVVDGYEQAIVKAVSKLLALGMLRENEEEERERSVGGLRAANAELEHLNRLKKNLVTTMSHEFRTALTGIQGFSEVIRDQQLSADSIKEFAIDICEDAKRLVHMINDMLDLERMEASSMRLQLEWINMNTIIQDVVSDLRSMSDQHPIRMQLAKALPILLGDREKLAQVIVNLICNAIEYAPDGGEVFVSTVVEGGLVHISVRDQGVGIAVMDLVRIFERYARVETGRTRYPGQSGLGLAIAREIIQMHGGRIWVESTVGKGSVFHFTVRFSDAS